MLKRYHALPKARLRILMNWWACFSLNLKKKNTYLAHLEARKTLQIKVLANIDVKIQDIALEAEEPIITILSCREAACRAAMEANRAQLTTPRI